MKKTVLSANGEVGIRFLTRSVNALWSNGCNTVGDMRRMRDPVHGFFMLRGVGVKMNGVLEWLHLTFCLMNIPDETPLPDTYCFQFDRIASATEEALPGYVTMGAD